ncbi:MAG: hypothetical protein LAQ30_27750, partial [Acidobacteriia bacterium]|nr:hypothetical protein [Terriglobia bacterium]
MMRRARRGIYQKCVCAAQHNVRRVAVGVPYQGLTVNDVVPVNKGFFQGRCAAMVFGDLDSMFERMFGPPSQEEKRALA